MNACYPSLNFYQAAMKMSLNINNALLQNAQRIRHYQLEQIDAALAEGAKVSAALEAVSNQGQWHAVCAAQARGQIEQVKAYWNGLSNRVGQNQMELASACQNQVHEAVGGLKQQTIKTAIRATAGVGVKTLTFEEPRHD